MDQIASLLETHTAKTAGDITAINDSHLRVTSAQEATQHQLSEITVEADKRNKQSEAKFDAAAGQIGDLSHLLASFLRAGVSNENALERGIQVGGSEIEEEMVDSFKQSWCALVSSLTAPNLTCLRPVFFKVMTDFCYAVVGYDTPAFF